jgi:hypothetical protein
MSKLDHLRAGLTELQRTLLNTIWNYELEQNRGIPAIALCDSLALQETEIDAALSPLGGDIVFSTGADYARRRYQMTFLGYLLAERGPELEDLLVRYLDYVRKLLKSDPETEKINLQKAIDACGFSSNQAEFFRKMFFRTPFHGSGSASETNFPSQSDEWYSHPDLRGYFHERVVRNYNQARPVDRERQELIKLAEWDVSNDLDLQAPHELFLSLDQFRSDHPDPDKVCFVMMRFGKTPAHRKIHSAIESVLAAADMTAVRADQKQYNDDLYSNILTYMHGCGSGVAVFERLEGDNFNPNVAFEVGYMLSMKRPVCLLKDRTLPNLHADLMGKIYKEFDPQAPRQTIPAVLSRWLADKGLSDK